MNQIIISIISGLLGSGITYLGYRTWLSRQRVKLPMMFKKVNHKVIIDCKGKTIGHVMQLVHEHSLWFAEQLMVVKFEPMERGVIAYHLNSDADLAMFKLRWAGHAEYIYDN